MEPGHRRCRGTAVGNIQIDEAFIFAFGDWGRTELGSRDAATYRMYYGTPSALIGWGAIQHNHNWANASVIANNKAYGRTMATTITPTWQDVNRINYFTPRFAGLQIGVGYAPKIIAAAASGQASAGPLNIAGSCGFAGAANINNCPSADYAWQDAFDVGANYLNKFGDFTVALYGAFAYASFVPGYQPLAGAANMATGANLTNWKQWVLGAQFGFAGFTVGGAVGWDNNGVGANYFTGVDNDTRFYTAGIMYETGPWQRSAAPRLRVRLGRAALRAQHGARSRCAAAPAQLQILRCSKRRADRRGPHKSPARPALLRNFYGLPDLGGMPGVVRGSGGVPLDG